MLRASLVLLAVSTISCKTSALEPTRPVEPGTSPGVTPADAGAETTAVAGTGGRPDRHPETLDEAAQQLARWLLDPVAVPPPPLLAAGTPISVREHVRSVIKGADDPQVRSFSVEDDGALRAKIDEIVSASSTDPLWVRPTVSCDATCCQYSDPDTVGGVTLVRLDAVCMSRGPDGRPSAYTIVDLGRTTGVETR